MSEPKTCSLCGHGHVDTVVQRCPNPTCADYPGGTAVVVPQLPPPPTWYSGDSSDTDMLVVDKLFQPKCVLARSFSMWFWVESS
jgi:hypothetical protein